MSESETSTFDPQTGEKLAEPSGPAVVPFAAFAQDLRQGRFHAEATDALHELVDAVTRFSKEGELVLKFKVKPVGEGGVQVTVVDDVIVKAPTAARPLSLFFVDDANNLTRDDPHNLQFALREVPPQPHDTAELKDVR